MRNKINLYNSLRHSIEKRYFFPDIEIGANQEKLVQLDAYIPEYLAISCIPYSNRTIQQREFKGVFDKLIKQRNTVSTLPTTWIYGIHDIPMLDILDVGVVSQDINTKLRAFFVKLKELDIVFAMVGLGGGGSNANRIFGRMYNDFPYLSYDYDKVELHNIARMFSPQSSLDKSAVRGGVNGKFNINTTRRTLVYSGVDYHDRQTVCENENIMAVQVGFRDDTCVMSVNPPNDGIFAGDTYGLINTHTMMLNAYRGVEIFVDWFLELSDSEINEYFTKSSKISEFSILDDDDVTSKLFLEPIVKTPTIPIFLDINNKPSIYEDIKYRLLDHSMQQLSNELSVDTTGYSMIPMFKLSDDDHELLHSEAKRLSEYELNDYEYHSVFHGKFTTELMETNLENAIQEANYRFEKFPSTFIGIMMAVDDTTRINILHPLTAIKVMGNLDKFKDTFKFWIYMADRDLNVPDVEEDTFGILKEMVEIASNVPKEEIVNTDRTIDFSMETGEVLGVASTYEGGYLLGIDTYLYNGSEQVPYYGYIIGHMNYTKFNMEYLTESVTGNNNKYGDDVCTGDACSSLFSSRYRQHMLNHQSVYEDNCTPVNEYKEISTAIDISLDMYYDFFNFN